MTRTCISALRIERLKSRMPELEGTPTDRLCPRFFQQLLFEGGWLDSYRAQLSTALFSHDFRLGNTLCLRGRNISGTWFSLWFIPMQTPNANEWIRRWQPMLYHFCNALPWDEEECVKPCKLLSHKVLPELQAVVMLTTDRVPVERSASTPMMRELHVLKMVQFAHRHGYASLCSAQYYPRDNHLPIWLTSQANSFNDTGNWVQYKLADFHFLLKQSRHLQNDIRSIQAALLKKHATLITYDEGQRFRFQLRIAKDKPPLDLGFLEWVRYVRSNPPTKTQKIIQSHVAVENVWFWNFSDKHTQRMYAPLINNVRSALQQRRLCTSEMRQQLKARVSNIEAFMTYEYWCYEFPQGFMVFGSLGTQSYACNLVAKSARTVPDQYMRIMHRECYRRCVTSPYLTQVCPESEPVVSSVFVSARYREPAVPLSVLPLSEELLDALVLCLLGYHNMGIVPIQCTLDHILMFSSGRMSILGVEQAMIYSDLYSENLRSDWWLIVCALNFMEIAKDLIRIHGTCDSFLQRANAFNQLVQIVDDEVDESVVMARYHVLETMNLYNELLYDNITFATLYSEIVYGARPLPQLLTMVPECGLTEYDMLSLKVLLQNQFTVQNVYSVVASQSRCAVLGNVILRQCGFGANSNVELVRRLGDGTYGQVFLLNSPKKRFAMKVTQTGKSISVAAQLYEIEIQKHIHAKIHSLKTTHFKVVVPGVHKTCQYDDLNVIISVQDYIELPPRIKYSSVREWKLLLEFLHLLHTRGIVHGDAHPENLKISIAQKTIYVLDFGRAVLQESVPESWMWLILCIYDYYTVISTILWWIEDQPSEREALQAVLAHDTPSFIQMHYGELLNKELLSQGQHWDVMGTLAALKSEAFFKIILSSNYTDANVSAFYSTLKLGPSYRHSIATIVGSPFKFFKQPRSQKK